MKLKSIFRPLLSAVTIATTLTAMGAEPTETVRATGSNYYAYPYTDAPAPALTPAPKGYVPFHMEHYGRHGSRWHIGSWVYPQPIKLLEPAERAGKLTPRGKEILAQLRTIEQASHGRDGELTPLGARQPRGIARRMVKNFPEIFTAGTFIDAKSTPVVRCILSMSNELQEIESLKPGVKVRCDASYATQPILNYTDTTANKIYASTGKERKELIRPVAEAHKPSYQFLDHIVTDRKWAMDSMDVKNLLSALFRIASNTQSHDDQPSLYDIFTEQELNDCWAVNNLEWFLQYGNNPYTKGRGAMIQRYLLEDIILGADSALVSPNRSANLRFGHEVALMLLAVLMELGHYGEEITDMTQVEEKWKNHEIFPMGSNIQLIFYRRPGATDASDVLVKAMLNEREMSLPGTPVTGPYYNWKEVAGHYLNRLNMPIDAPNTKK